MGALPERFGGSTRKPVLTVLRMTLDLAQQLPREFGLWPPLWQALTLFASTFILEDVAAVGAGVLLATGVLAWPTAFLACFLGIWAGDGGLYALARLVGRPWFERTPLRRFSARVERSERWFADRGISVLIFSRLVPGARLPTYLAAGFLRLPIKRFLLITGCASLVWTVIVLLATQVLGVGLLGWLGSLRQTAWLMLGLLAVVLGVLHAARKLATPRRLQVLVARLGRWTHWEFWPAWVFYAPVALYYPWLAYKYRGFALPTIANPGMFSGGVIGESKMAILQSLMDTSPEFTVEAELLKGSTTGARLRSLREICHRRQITYPFVLKPDVGQRGAGVKLIHDEQQALAYLGQTAAALLVQRYAEGPHELGVFYYRFPHEARGHIFSATEKVFPFVTGDGQSTVSELVWKDPRARFMAAKYLRRLNGRQGEVLPAGQRLKLVEAGNHAQGCIFRDGMRLCTEALAARIDGISQRVKGFYIGRYDIRYPNEDDLRAGRSFQIVELNGAASEATSIYDARNSLISAYRTLFRQWDLVFAIGAANRRDGCLPTKLSLLGRKWREYAKQAATYPAAD
jgi:membrane protein DedA with SNARE-associated domain